MRDHRVEHSVNKKCQLLLQFVLFNVQFLNDSRVYPMGKKAKGSIEGHFTHER